MFCQNCGTEIQQNVKYCSNCGFEINQGKVIERKTSEIANENFDREALKIYLGNVLALECGVSKLNNTIERLKRDVESLEKSNCNVITYYPLDRQHSTEGFYFGYEAGTYFVMMDPYGRITSRKNAKSGWAPFDEIQPNLRRKDTFHQFVKVGFSGFFESIIAHHELKDLFLHYFETFKKEAPKIYEDKRLYLSLAKEKIEKCEREADEAKSILHNAYSINIIPSNFRHNLYAIYYLHDFITTSELSLETALLHYNLEEIKSKLETIIEMQRNIIINQSIIQSQNAELLSTQQQTLEHLADIEKNSARAAQYAEIAANNAEACAWIATAIYIKD